MTDAGLAKTIDDAFEQRDGISPSTKGAVREAVETALDLLDRGEARRRTANGDWTVNQWLKKAVLLSFRLNDMSVISGGPGKAAVVGQGRRRSSTAGTRHPLSSRGLPRGAELRGAPLGLYRAGRRADAVLRQSRRLRRSGTMIDTWATVGSCAQIGKNCHTLGRRRHRRRAGAAAGRPR